jgi:predicted nucleotidyltransferase
MPVRSLRSSLLRWPTVGEVDRAARAWAEQLAEEDPAVLAAGYFGSYARGDWGVGSDLDLIVIVERHGHDYGPIRALDWRLDSLPVPAELLSYSLDDWQRLMGSDRRFARTLRDETVWLTGEDRVTQPEPTES